MQDYTSGCTIGSNNLMSTNPLLVNTSTAPYDFHLQPGSPAIGAGVPVPDLAVDFDGAPRSTGSVSDVGAYAFLAQTIPPIASIENGASLVDAPVAPGEIVLLFGIGMGPETPVGYSVDASGMVDTMLAGVRVLFDGTPAPMIYASAAAVMAIVPYSVAGELRCRIQVEFNGAVSPDLDVPVVSSMPGIFTADRSGTGQGLVQNQDFSRNSAANPAAKGSVIVFYGTGEGRTDPPGIDGFVVTDVVRTPLLPVSVTIGGQTADVLYAGSEPGWACGMLQVYVRVPAGIASGNGVPLVLSVGGNSSAPGVTIAVL